MGLVFTQVISVHLFRDEKQSDSGSNNTIVAFSKRLFLLVVLK